MPTTTPKQQMPRITKKKFYHDQVTRRALTPAQEKQFDRIMERALACVDRDDHAGFWDGIEKLNAFSLLARDRD